MAKRARRTRSAESPRTVVRTDEFERWTQTLSDDVRSEVNGLVDRIVAGGPTLGRPRVDLIHRSTVHRLKEGRSGRGMRVLFAFDSNGNAVMLAGGDKTGKWNDWYPKMIRLAERLYAVHDCSIRKEPHCLSRREAGRTSHHRSR
jgi:hypothetical protein